MRFTQFLLFTATIFSQNAWASFDIVPITQVLTPSGNGATASFTVKNHSDQRTPVQITIIPREPDINGNENFKNIGDTDDRFQVFPSQIILKPKDTQTIRVTWVGNPKITSELPFRMISEELPIILPEPGKIYKKPVGRLTIMSRYIGSLYVTPTGAQANLLFKAVESPEKKGHMLLEIENKGTSHQVIRKDKFKFSTQLAGGGSKDIEWQVDPESPLFQANILANQSRKVTIPWPPKLPVGPVTVTLLSAKE
ncbi:MAG: hypothetical protein AABZ55_07395 [Bdellovibrionota bacterium]